MDTKNLAGSVKVAILVQFMSREKSQKILDGLNSDERELVEKHLSQMGRISPDVVEKVAKEFTEMAEQVKPRQAEEDSASEEEDSTSEEEADLISRSPNLGILRSLDADRLIQLIKDEHPQTIAIIIAHLKTETASEVLSELPDAIKSDVATRIASLSKVISGMVEEINKVFEDVLKGSEVSVTRKAGGVERLAEILNQTSEASGELILNEIEESDPELADEIKQRMFVFEDLVLIDDKDFQKVLRFVETKELAMALKAASEEVKEKVFKNMSERASEILQEEIEVLGAVRMTEVTDAQQMIAKIIREMEAKKELTISGRRGEKFIG